MKALRNGFSLVELLVALAVISLLASVGVTSFRRMLMKARQAEVFVTMGGIRAAENAFFSEHDTYGNRFDKMGVEMVGARRYTVGFPLPNCSSELIVKPHFASVPSLQAQFPAYYSGTLVSVVPKTIGISGTENCYFIGQGSVNGTVGVSWDGSEYMISGTGPIAPGTDSSTGIIRTAANESSNDPKLAFSLPQGPLTVTRGYFQDVWLMNHKGVFENVTDGTTPGCYATFGGCN